MPKALFENTTAVDLLENCNATAAELCFFSLTLRHTQRLDDVKRAQELLQELVTVVVPLFFGWLLGWRVFEESGGKALLFFLLLLCFGVFFWVDI